MKFRFAFVAAIALATAPALAPAQDRYPSRAVTIVNPNAPGGQVDLTMRPLVAPLERALKQPIVLANRPGAAGAIGIAQVAHAAPDGYTLLATSPAIDTIPSVDRLLGREPAYTVDQLIGIAMFNQDPTVLVVHPSLPVTTAREFVDYARVHTGEIVVSSSGAYGATHLPMAMLELAENLRFRNLTTPGGGPALIALLGGNAQAYAAPPGVAAPQIQAGKIKALAHWGTGRMAQFPDVPSFQEVGVNVEYWFWIGMFAPAKTPPAILQRIHAALREAIKDPEFTTAMEKINLPVVYRDGDAFNAWWREDLKRLTATIQGIGKIEEGK